MTRRPRPAHIVRRYLYGYTMERRLHFLSDLVGQVFAPLERLLAPRSTYQRLPPASAFDEAYGVETAASRPWQVLGDGNRNDAYSTDYSASSPTALRTALARLPDLRDFTFVDLGCGKGRALIVASEHPFKAIIGVEKSKGLVRIAEDNLRIVATAYPERPVARVVHGDAAAFAMPPGDLLVYLFHPFWLPVMSALADSLAAAVVERRRLFVVYLNPIVRGPLDACPGLTAAPELSFVLPADDERQRPLTVAVWRGRDDR